MGEKQRRYISYLLRLWQVAGDSDLVWRASLENPHTGERRGFPCLADLVAFLQKEMSNNGQSQRQ